jgi:hypothetical protein
VASARRTRRLTAILVLVGLATFAALSVLPGPGPGEVDRKGEVPEARDIPHEPPATLPPPIGGGVRFLRR